MMEWWYPSSPFPPLCFVEKALLTPPQYFHSEWENARGAPVFSVNILGLHPPPTLSQKWSRPRDPSPFLTSILMGKEAGPPPYKRLNPRGSEKGVSLESSTDSRKPSEETELYACFPVVTARMCNVRVVLWTCDLTFCVNSHCVITWYLPYFVFLQPFVSEGLLWHLGAALWCRFERRFVVSEINNAAWMW